MFDDGAPGTKYEVWKYRPMPCTPAGDFLCHAQSRDHAQRIADGLEKGLTLEQAMAA
jgi:hypothetical protein